MMISIEKADGSVWIQDESDTQATASATSLAGVWKGIGSTTGPFSRALNAMPLTPAGEAARASYNFQAESPIRECIPPPAPGTVVGSTVYLNEFQLLDDRVVIRSEFFDAERIVYLDGRGHPADGERTNQGHSIGRWEGDTLVVDTVAITTKSFIDSSSPHSNQMSVHERIRLIAPDILEDQITVHDPVALEEPWQITRTYRKAAPPDDELREFACAEGLRDAPH
jgi:hypothetical protein